MREANMSRDVARKLVDLLDLSNIFSRSSPREQTNNKNTGRLSTTNRIDSWEHPDLNMYASCSRK